MEREGKDRGNRVAKRGEDGIDEEGGHENISNADQSGSYSNSVIDLPDLK